MPISVPASGGEPAPHEGATEPVEEPDDELLEELELLELELLELELEPVVPKPVEAEWLPEELLLEELLLEELEDELEELELLEELADELDALELLADACPPLPWPDDPPSYIDIARASSDGKLTPSVRSGTSMGVESAKTNSFLPL